MHPGPTRHRVALVIALVGVALSAVTLLVHHRLAVSAGYTSFCNLGDVVNCDVVLSSRYGRVLGIPVPFLGLVAFAAGALLAVPGALGRRGTWLADLAVLGLASASVGFALVLGVVMAVVLRHACLLCLGLDVVILAWLVTVAPLVARFDGGGTVSWWRRRAAARGALAAGLVAALTGGTWAAAREPAPVTSVAEVQARDPRFYAWYTGLPVRAAGDLAGRDGHRKGPPGAAVAIVEFSDFQCPFCVQAFRDLRELVRRRLDVSVVFRHFPLDASCNGYVTRSLHPDACLAACAAECAGQQGRFWEYHDVLFENHRSLERESLFRYAREMQLDIPAFRGCLDDPATRARVGEDIEAGARAGVTSTPTLFINGRIVEGALDPPYYEYALIIERHARHGHDHAS
jgi:uncharacterized membrane protein/predicted DsbA family dithiol-disulfide isomerase